MPYTRTFLLFLKAYKYFLGLLSGLGTAPASRSGYNNTRLNSAIGYITLKHMLAGHQQEIQAERDRKLEAAAREQRKNRRQRAA